MKGERRGHRGKWYNKHIQMRLMGHHTHFGLRLGLAFGFAICGLVTLSPLTFIYCNHSLHFFCWNFFNKKIKYAYTLSLLFLQICRRLHANAIRLYLLIYAGGIDPPGSEELWWHLLCHCLFSSLIVSVCMHNLMQTMLSINMLVLNYIINYIATRHWINSSQRFSGLFGYFEFVVNLSIVGSLVKFFSHLQKEPTTYLSWCISLFLSLFI